MQHSTRGAFARFLHDASTRFVTTRDNPKQNTVLGGGAVGHTSKLEKRQSVEVKETKEKRNGLRMGSASR